VKTLYTSDCSGPLVDSSAVARLVQCQAFLVRVADVEGAYRKLLRSCKDRDDLAVQAERFQLALSRVCSEWLNGSSPAEAQVFRLSGDRHQVVAHPDSIRTSLRIPPRLDS